MCSPSTYNQTNRRRRRGRKEFPYHNLYFTWAWLPLSLAGTKGHTTDAGTGNFWCSLSLKLTLQAMHTSSVWAAECKLEMIHRRRSSDRFCCSARDQQRRECVTRSGWQLNENWLWVGWAVVFGCSGKAADDSGWKRSMCLIERERERASGKPMEWQEYNLFI